MTEILIAAIVVLSLIPLVLLMAIMAVSTYGLMVALAKYHEDCSSEEKRWKS